MADYLIFQLYGPMAAWGEIAVGETRRSSAHPSKSAILGLLGASMGIDRQEEKTHAAMAGGYYVAIKVLSMGSLLVDYHTVQVPPEKKKIVYHTRREELAADKLGTLLSSREYRCDATYVVAISITHEGAPFSLEELADALSKPIFTVYMGRKACPLAQPLAPEIIKDQTLKAALDSRKHFTQEMAWIIRNQPALYYWEADPDGSLSIEQSSERWDQPRSRHRWQFGPRVENMNIGREEA
jgi:CRISPR system Cascade subunit CasD